MSQLSLHSQFKVNSTAPPDFGVHVGRDVFQHEAEARRVVGLGRRVLHPHLAERLPQHGVQHGRPALSSGQVRTVLLRQRDSFGVEVGNVLISFLNMLT